MWREAPSTSKTLIHGKIQLIEKLWELCKVCTNCFHFNSHIIINYFTDFFYTTLRSMLYYDWMYFGNFFHQIIIIYLLTNQPIFLWQFKNYMTIRILKWPKYYLYTLSNCSRTIVLYVVNEGIFCNIESLVPVNATVVRPWIYCSTT